MSQINTDKTFTKHLDKTTTTSTTTSTSLSSSSSSSASSSSSIFLMLAGAKQKRKLGATLNESVATGPNDFAKRQLEKLGWTEGTGLGKKRNGRTTHIRVQPRENVQSGMGSHNNNAMVSAEQWWKTSLGHTLAKLSSSNNKKKKSKKDKKNKVKSNQPSSSISTKVSTKPKKLLYTDQELFQATGGVRFGMRAQTQQHSKWMRTESDITSEVQEQEAKRKIEWNGLTAPRVVLPSLQSSSFLSDDDSKHNKKRKRSSRESISENNDNNNKMSLPSPPPSSGQEKLDEHDVNKSTTRKKKKMRQNNDDDKKKVMTTETVTTSKRGKEKRQVKKKKKEKKKKEKSER
jgi:Pin2-interacting protein X1